MSAGQAGFGKEITVHAMLVSAIGETAKTKGQSG